MYILAPVLVIRVHINDDIRTPLERCIDACFEGPCQPFCFSEVNDVVSAAFLCHLASLVSAAVVNDQYLDTSDTLYLSGYILDGYGKRLFFVEGWYLDDEFEFLLMHGDLTFSFF